MDGFDNLRPPAVQPDDDVRFICFTNVPTLPRVYPWEYRPVYVAGAPCRTSRVAKILPHLMLPDDTEFSIWHDGNFQLRKGAHLIVDELLGHHDWAAHQHPCRTCIYDEADILIREKIGTPELVEAEVGRYKEQGYPSGAGLWANGLIVRRHTAETAELNERWWRLYAAGCERDQLSFPVARRESGMEIRTITEGGGIYDSPYTLFRWHAAWSHRDDNPDYWPQRNRLRERLRQLAAVTGSDGGIRHFDY